MDKKYTIGIDFGSLSARAVIVDVENGNVKAVGESSYPHGILEDMVGNVPIPDGMFLQKPEDYRISLKESVKKAISQSGVEPRQIIGLGVDSTSATLIAVNKAGQPLCELQDFEDNPFAYILMWKSHATSREVEDIIAAARQQKEYFLKYTGEKISDNLAIPKILHLLRHAPEIYEGTERFYDISDWIVRLLTGQDGMNDVSAGGKFFWNPETGYPSKDFFEMLDDRMKNIAEEKLPGKIWPSWEGAGKLSEEWGEMLGIPAGISVSPGHNDGMVPLLSVGMNKEKIFSMAIGTGVASHTLCRKYVKIEGIYSLTHDAPYPGYYCYETGLHSFGDTLAWFIENACPVLTRDENKDVFDVLNENAACLKPGESGLLALNWWNGNRSPLLDGELSGVILGLTLKTKSEEIYRALIEAFAFNYRLIIEEFEYHGIEIDEIIAAGGIPMKNRFIMQLLCDILGKRICVPKSQYLPAIGSAIFAAVAAKSKCGGYDSSDEAIAAMCVKQREYYLPDKNITAQYDDLYNLYKKLCIHLGKNKHGPLKQLLHMKDTKKNHDA